MDLARACAYGDSIHGENDGTRSQVQSSDLEFDPKTPD